MCGREYRPKEHLDRYDARDIDERDYAPLTAEQRAKAEADMADRDRRAALGRRGLPEALREEVHHPFVLVYLLVCAHVGVLGMVHTRAPCGHRWTVSALCALSACYRISFAACCRGALTG
jgi:hypothetical protein